MSPTTPKPTRSGEAGSATRRDEAPVDRPAAAPVDLPDGLPDDVPGVVPGGVEPDGDHAVEGGAEVEKTLDHFETFLERIEDAAIEAEQETGYHETTREAAQRGLLKRVGIVIGGTLVLIVGLLLLALPGPGLVVVALGLGILSMEVPFANRLLEKVKKRLPTDEDGKFPRSAIVMMVVFAVLATTASTWWALR